MSDATLDVEAVDGAEDSSIVIEQYTTVCKDKYGRYYNLSKEHPSWEEVKKGITICTVVDAFTCSIEEVNRLTKG